MIYNPILENLNLFYFFSYCLNRNYFLLNSRNRYNSFIIRMYLNNFVYKFFNNFNIIEDDWLFDSYLDKSRNLYKFLGNLFNFIYFRNLTVYLNNFLLNSLDLFNNLLSLNYSNWFLFNNFNLLDLLCNIRNNFLNLFDGLFGIRFFFNFYYFFYCSNLFDDLNNFIF